MLTKQVEERVLYYMVTHALEKHFGRDHWDRTCISWAWLAELSYYEMDLTLSTLFLMTCVEGSACFPRTRNGLGRNPWSQLKNCIETLFR